MICGSLSVLFLSLLTLVELTIIIERNVTCGENIEIPSDCNGTTFCDPNCKMESMKLGRNNNNTFLEIENLTNVDQNCSENGKFCLKVAKDRKRAILTMHGVTFTDEGRYDLYFQRSDGNTQPIIIHVFVYGICEPIVSRSEDELTCEGTMKNTSDPTIEWMSKERKRYPGVPMINRKEDYITWRITLKLTDETRQMAMCCTASYIQSKSEEKQNCLPVTAGSYKLNEDKNRTKIMIPILCVMGTAIILALYVYLRRRRSFTQPRRENTKEAQSDPLQGPKDKV